MTQANVLLFFSNGDGGEVWTRDGSVDGTRIATSKFGDEVKTQIILSSYPNPFTDHFTLRVEAGASEEFSINAFTLYGETVEEVGVIRPGTSRQIGQSWGQGMYVLVVANRAKRTTFIVRKQ